MNQCEGYTKSGLRCKKKTLDISKRCHLHLKQTIQEEPREEPKSRPEQRPDQQKPRTRSETRRLLEEALLTYQRLYQHNQHNDVRENIEQLIRLEMEKERIMNEMRVKEPPRRPRKPIRRNTNKKEQEKKPDLPKEDCCVCFENNVEKDEMLECKHSVCKGCVKQLRDPRCPMCRSDIKSKFITDKDIRTMKIKSRADARNRTDESIREYLMQERFFIGQETRQRMYIVDEF